MMLDVLEIDCEELACIAVEVLSERKGFDPWWYNLNKETRDDIITAIGEALHESLVACATSSEET